ncbi:hypothetical protein ES705_07084 [subsurface metagenome]
MGSKPKTFEDWFWAPLKTIGMAIVGVIITIGMGFAELIMLIIDFVVEIFMDILPILAYILWLIIRVLLLILIWIIFMFTLILVIAMFVITTGVLLALKIFMDYDLDISINRVETTGDIDLFLVYNIGVDYNNFLCFYIPTIELQFGTPHFQIDYVSNGFSPNLNFTDYPEDLFYNFTNNGPSQSSVGFPQQSSGSSIGDFLIDGFTYFGIGMGVAGGYVAVFSSILTYLESSARGFAYIMLGVGLYVA